MARESLRLGRICAVLFFSALVMTPVCIAEGLVSNSTWLDLDDSLLFNPGDTTGNPITPIVRYNATTGWLSVDTRGVNCSADSVPDPDGYYPTVAGDDVGFASIVVEGPSPILGTEASWMGTGQFGMAWQPLTYIFGKAQTSGLALDGAMLPPGLYDLWQYPPLLTLPQWDVLNSDGIVTLEIGLNESLVPPRGLSPIFSQFEIVDGIWGDLNNDNVVDDLDIDALAAAVRMGSTDSKYDLNYDCSVDYGVSPSGELNTDSDELVRVILGTEYADANLDKVVDILDFSALSGGYFTADNWAAGDFTGDATVNIQDFSALSTFYFFDNTNTVVAVPEPNSLIAILGAMIAMLGARWPARTLQR